MEQALLPDDVLESAADCLRVMAHPIRLRIVSLLTHGDFPVHHIAQACRCTPNQTCEHLRLLKTHGLLASERRGRAVYYRIASARLPRLIECIRQTCHQGRENT
jgi:ArsR family transcriptional regulator, zinc-responsive transcriptional repressor